jgi:hypothetical protein
VDHRNSGPPWTGGHCRSRELVGARPPAAPVSKSSDRRAGEGEGGPANSMAGLSRLRRQWKGGSPATEILARKDDGEGVVRARREGVGGVGCFTGAGSAFIGRRQGRAASMTGVEGASMAGVEGTGYRLLKRGNGIK